jgi:DNA-binding protein HU-beta
LHKPEVNEMNRRELVRVIAAHTGQDPRQVDQTLRGFTEVTTALVAKGEPVAITGFAKFAKVQRAARMGRNPATGEAIRIKASKKVRVTPLKGFKDAVLTPSLAPKLARGVLAAGKTPARATASSTARATAAAPAKKAATRTTAKATAAAPAKKAATKATATKATAKKAPAKKATATTRAASVRTGTTRTTAARKAPVRRKTTP